MLGRRRGGSSLIPGKGDAALAAAPFGKPPSPRCPPAAAHLTPSPGQLRPGIPWPHVASRRLISRSAAGSCPAPPPPQAWRPKLCPAGLLHAPRFPQRPRFRVSGFAVLCLPRQGRPPTLSPPHPSLFAALTPRLSPRSPSECIPRMRPHPSGIGLLPSPLPRLRFCGLTSIPALMLCSLYVSPLPQTRFPHVPLGISHLLTDAFLS